LRVTLFELSPRCRRVVSFRRRGHAGLNVVRIRVLIAGKRLGPGTYRITVRSPSRIVLRRRFVVARSRPTTHAAYLTALHRDACAATASRARLISAPIAAPRTATPPTGGVAGSRAILHPRSGHPSAGRILGSLVVPSTLDPAWLKSVLLAGLGLALALLALAALPQRALSPGGLAVVVGRHRAGFAASGMALLGAVVLAALLV